MDNKTLGICMILIATIVAQATWVVAENDGPTYTHLVIGQDNKLGEMLKASPCPDKKGHFYEVGDDKGWNPGVDYQAWACGKDFSRPVTIAFKYKAGEHNVIIVDEDTFNKCGVTPNTPPSASPCGNNVATLDQPGTYYFVSGVGEDCKNGMKIAICVK